MRQLLCISRSNFTKFQEFPGTNFKNFVQDNFTRSIFTFCELFNYVVPFPVDVRLLRSTST